MAEAFMLDDGRVALVMSSDEATLTTMMMGNIMGGGEVRNIADEIYYTLMDVPIEYPAINSVFAEAFRLTGKGLHEPE